MTWYDMIWTKKPWAFILNDTIRIRSQWYQLNEIETIALLMLIESIFNAMEWMPISNQFKIENHMVRECGVAVLFLLSSALNLIGKTW